MANGDFGKYMMSMPHKQYFQFSLQSCTEAIIWLYGENSGTYMYEIIIGYLDNQQVLIRDIRDAQIKAEETLPGLLR